MDIGQYQCLVILAHSQLFHTFSAAYKHADGKKIDGRRIVVDVERGRTVKNWKPRRLGKFFSMIKLHICSKDEYPYLIDSEFCLAKMLWKA